ncbi:XRE family transcriptional regulator [Periweissella cryptocerci]|uniref:XRE family transcriptional regulator n=1 Tax=Periweissella cryptocerci TaxID=2506420 RepID=A0A4P6YSR0_9LACO|nr:helix-turn-helix transcriptional regulator [Periweissella cryptocerci]QBO35663.1 XRE family transcriptional regulator [Periweissella cryptocerci]
MDYKLVEKKLAELNYIISISEPDSDAFQDASQKMDEILFENINIREFSFIGKHIDGEITLEMEAKMIVAAAEGKPLTAVVPLSANDEAAYKIRRARIAQNISQVELAQKAGMTQSQIAKVENAQMNLTLDVVQRIMSVLGDTFLIKPIEIA